VVHAAATKIVPAAEYNSVECIRTNINGAINVIEAAIDEKVEKIVALSTDKACNPVNLYGATKLASDKLFVSANLRTEETKTCLSVVRYGNVIGSRGSVIPFFERKKETGVFPITDDRMTRFMISIEQGVNLVWHALEDSQGGEIYVHKIPSMRITDIARAVDESLPHKIIGVRPGEKIHETMIGQQDAQSSYEYDWYYKILPTLENWHLDPARIKSGVKVDEEFSYSSDNNSDWMTVEMLRQFLNSKSYSNLQALNI
jgi:FlaA1/EpsC-like NDP-sugar epimerase